MSRLVPVCWLPIPRCRTVDIMKNMNMITVTHENVFTASLHQPTSIDEVELESMEALLNLGCLVAGLRMLSMKHQCMQFLLVSRKRVFTLGTHFPLPDRPLHLGCLEDWVKLSMKHQCMQVLLVSRNRDWSMYFRKNPILGSVGFVECRTDVF